MRTPRSLALLVVTALAGSLLALVAPSASARAEFPTRVTMTISAKKAHYNDTFSISGQVQAKGSNGWGYIPSDAGGVVLQRQYAGEKKWQKIGQDSTGSSFYFSDLKSQGSATYRVVYAGGASGDATFPKAQETRDHQTFRKLNDKLTRPGNKIVLKGKVAPDWKKRPVVVERKTCEKKCKWQKFKTIRTNQKSQFSTQIPAPRKGSWYFRAFVQKSGRLEKSFSDYVYRTYRF